MSGCWCGNRELPKGPALQARPAPSVAVRVRSTTGSPHGDPAASARREEHLHRPGLSTLIDRIHQKFGDSTGYELDLYPEYAIIERADPDEPKGLISYLYREGTFDDPDRRPRSFDNLGDVGAFDQAAILGIIRGAAQTLGIDRGEPSHVIIRPNAEGGLQINIYASRGNYESGYISVDAQGLNPKLYPPS